MIVKNITSFPIVITEKDKQIVLLPKKTARVNKKDKHVKQLLKLNYLEIVKEENKDE